MEASTLYPSPSESQPLTNGTRGQVHSGTGIHRKGFCQRVRALFQSHGVKLGYLYSYTKLHIYIYHCTLCTKDYFKCFECVTFLDPFCCDLNIFFLSVPPLLTKNALTVSVMNASEGCQSASCGHVIFPGFPPASFVWNVSMM